MNPVSANEIEQYSATTFEANHHNIHFVVEDIKNIHVQDFPSRIGVLAGGFPCQTFSITEYQRDFSDDCEFFF